ncbi:hypothetical protein D8T65_11620 [Vibrio vulnificus]|nr:hypothetical protein D8T65_11620 [Vibrio vulnificus]RZR46570.1 hypothetical protein D8T57_08440 [Vibrio vulnificus]HAS8108131.1 hypothetical protein [Vibrio vulnificus]HAS8157841.1 hypothetical protein [Vibrio vulnificus]HAS8302514.1 hypothetical protein [Vibrio vulnificus]
MRISPSAESSKLLRESFWLATDAFQKQLILRALESNQGNWAATARQLELDSGNLHRLAKRLGIM